jgi:hypothetical protein
MEPAESELLGMSRVENLETATRKGAALYELLGI